MKDLKEVLNSYMCKNLTLWDKYQCEYWFLHFTKKRKNTSMINNNINWYIKQLNNI